MNKQEILASLDTIQNHYCQDCFLHKHLKDDKGRRYAHRFCITQCTVGQKIKEYGEKLIK
ncbi:zinc-finger domain-containing protein [Bacillus sp. CGMCC 1.16607]|uniref:zinc-finger domain-containing protein n=1 Tax=Bacillus sp. CGMCC 1.16607 TaxID=3351842 RepID=UPI00363E88E8